MIWCISGGITGKSVEAGLGCFVVGFPALLAVEAGRCPGAVAVTKLSLQPEALSTECEPNLGLCNSSV